METVESWLLAGVDLAWQTEKNTTAIAFGDLVGTKLTVSDVDPTLVTLSRITESLLSVENLRGVAIDASLVINNESGQRACERKLSSVYGSRKASCHASNLTLYPDAASVRLSEALAAQRFQHLGHEHSRWQLECYPHPAIIEFFELPERLMYKKGRVKTKQDGQIRLADLIQSFGDERLSLEFEPEVKPFLDRTHIQALRGKALKQNEDALDAIVCLIVAAHYALGLPGQIFGCVEEGYIYVPSGAS